MRIYSQNLQTHGIWILCLVDEVPKEYTLIRKLGTGMYASVHLVEVKLLLFVIVLCAGWHAVCRVQPCVVYCVHGIATTSSAVLYGTLYDTPHASPLCSLLKPLVGRIRKASRWP